FPDTDFFEVRFRQYPVAVLPPEGLSFSNVFLVENGEVFPLVTPGDLREFFLDNLGTVGNEDEAADAGLAWLRLSEGFSQDGFFTFSAPQVGLAPLPTGDLVVSGSVMVTMGGRGDIQASLYIDPDGILFDVTEKRNVLTGVRPICQATKLLDADPLVRRM